MQPTRGVPDALQRWRSTRFALPVMGACVLLVFVAAARGQVGLWKDNITLFRHALEVNEENDLAHNMLGCALLEAGRTEEAIAHFRESLRVNPGYPDAVMNLGVAYLNAVPEERLELLSVKAPALRQPQDYFPALGGDGLNAASGCQYLDPHRIEQIVHLGWQRPEPVFEIGYHDIDLFQPVQPCHILIQAQPGNKVGYVVLGDECRKGQVYYRRR